MNATDYCIILLNNLQETRSIRRMSGELDRIEEDLEKIRRIYELTLMLRAFTMSKELDTLKEELEKYRLTCDELRADNLSKQETVEKLTSELKASSSTTCKYAYDAVIGDDGPKRYRWELNSGNLKNKREEALERHRMEYENRVGTVNRSASNRSDEGYDEVDISK